MFTLHLAKELAQNIPIAHRVAERLGTMHYFLNLFQQEHYNRFLCMLDQCQSIEVVTQALKDYLDGNKPQKHKQLRGIKVMRCVDNHRTNAALYQIELTLSDKSMKMLNIGRNPSYFYVMYIVMLAFSRNNMPWKVDYLNETSEDGQLYVQKVINAIFDTRYNTQEIVMNLVPGEDEEQLNRPANRNVIYPANIRDNIIRDLNNNEKESYWFAPYNVGNNQFIIPLPATAIRIPKEINKVIVSWCRKIKERNQIINYDGYVINNENQIHQVLEKVKETLRDTTPFYIGSSKHNNTISGIEREKLLAAAREIENHCSLEDTEALNALADIYDQISSKDGMPNMISQDVSSRNFANEAFELWKKSAEKGDSQGQFRYGLYFILGELVETSFEEAFNWLQKAANQDHRDANWVLGKMYFYGLIGDRRNTKEAYKYYMKAAYFRSPEACRDCANCLMNGIGVETDVKLAYNFLRRAGELGDPVAREFCQTLMMGSDWLNPLPDDCIEDMKRMYNSVNWQNLSCNFDSETQVGKAALCRLIELFNRLGCYTKQENLLDLLDKFHNIPGERNWIEHVNEALYKHLSSGNSRTLEIKEYPFGRGCKYEVVFNNKNHLYDRVKGCNSTALIMYIIIAAFTKNKGCFERLYVSDYPEVCHNLWKLLDRNMGESVENLVKTNLMCVNNNKYNRRIPNYLGRFIEPKIKEIMKEESSYFFALREEIQTEGRGHTYKYFIHSDTEIIIPKEIEQVFKDNQ